jgi:predicted DNA-binding protein YlxM (UPF0122 family)
MSDNLFFFENFLIPLIAEEYKISEEQALHNYVFSETYQMLSDYETKLFRESPLLIWDLYQAEIATGDPRNSTYIQTI